MRATSGMTLISFMVVVGIVGALYGLVMMPTMTVSRTCCRKSSCGNNQRQIVLAMLVYANENDGAWPCRPSDATGLPVSRPGRDKFTTISTFEFLAAQTGREMPPKVFACPSEPMTKPTTQAGATIDYASSIASAWCLAAARSSAANPGYVYDWSVPTNANAMRVVTADRGRGRFAHKHQVVMACFGDGHVNNLKVAPTSDPTTTSNLDDSRCAFGAINRDADGDDVFTASADGDDPMTPGKGSATRAWVR
jgi:type II secretory pathway pseudopilin PulG